MSKLVDRNCPICGSIQYSLMYSQHFSSITSGSLLKGYDVVICDQCGFCFAQNIPEQKAFDEYYSNLSKYEPIDPNARLSLYTLNHYDSTARWLAKHIPEKKKRILDIGCSTGYFLNALKTLGYSDLHGLDPSPLCSSFVKEKHAIDCEIGSLFDIQMGSSEYDVVTLCSVIEHIRDLDTALKLIYSILSPEGCLYIEIPDLSKFADEEDAPFQEFSVEHINFFTPTTICNLLAVYGFRKIALEQSAFEVGPGKTDFKIDGLFQKSELRKLPLEPENHGSKMAVEAYITRSQKEETTISQVIQKITEQGQPILVWGVGTLTQHLMAASSFNQANIVAFIDSNPHYQGKSLEGIPIISPKEVSNFPYPILISTRGFQLEINTVIKEKLRLPNQVFYLYPILSNPTVGQEQIDEEN